MLCRIGEVEVWRILEMNGPFFPPDELFSNAGPDLAKVISALDPHTICPRTGALILPVQGFLLRTPHHLVLVDACVGNHKTVPSPDFWHMRDSDRFLQALAAAGAAPEDVDYVMCTHLHSDHIGWNTRLLDGRWVPTFRNAKYLMPGVDIAEMAERAPPQYAESIHPVIEAGQAEHVEAGHRLGDELTLIPTPGHTDGHVSVLVESGPARAVITGDALHCTAQCWHPEWHFRYDAEPDRAVTSRRALLGRAASEDLRVLGSHMTLPSIGRVRAKGDAFEWRPDGDV
ncbi:Beta-lactamase-like protein [Candidatus Rhodobacter oscarellae]|uniref:Beta-lactamase-like protein n=1 Tax=Candidatus Rhodobacter oscarellae TaxID=1675527 RepID=A0A0J9E611_9RHOB|nr:MBL fold metallo-hydrolase [Candidatus Rhodobacter lobularis]KMW58190.1 Beta-lactamase-like protein [Candidatus Rhodobacter lobularis]